MTVVRLTMKWFNRTAQGFSPGNRQKKPRPERATDIRGVASWRRHFLPRRERPDSIALSGRAPVGAFPKAKTLGCSLYALPAKEATLQIHPLRPNEQDSNK